MTQMPILVESRAGFIQDDLEQTRPTAYCREGSNELHASLNGTDVAPIKFIASKSVTFPVITIMHEVTCLL